MIPLVTGLLLGPFFVTSLLVGTLAGCLMLGITFSIAGGAMDNAKKGIESGLEGGKGTPSHRASISGPNSGSRSPPCPSLSPT